MHPHLLTYSQAVLDVHLSGGAPSAIPSEELVASYGHEFLLEVNRTIICLGRAMKTPSQY